MRFLLILYTCIFIIFKYSLPILIPIDLLIELRDTNGVMHCNCDQKCLGLQVTYDIQPQHEADILMGIIITYTDFPIIRYRRKVMFTSEDLLSIKI